MILFGDRSRFVHFGALVKALLLSMKSIIFNNVPPVSLLNSWLGLIVDLLKICFLMFVKYLHLYTMLLCYCQCYLYTLLLSIDSLVSYDWKVL